MWLHKNWSYCWCFGLFIWRAIHFQKAGQAFWPTQTYLYCAWSIRIFEFRCACRPKGWPRIQIKRRWISLFVKHNHQQRRHFNFSTFSKLGFHSLKYYKRYIFYWKLLRPASLLSLLDWSSCIISLDDGVVYWLIEVWCH